MCKSDWIDYAKALIAKEGLQKIVSIVPGGETALDSQYNGLLEVKRLYGVDDITVLIHDGVRPLVDRSTMLEIYDLLKQRGVPLR